MYRLYYHPLCPFSRKIIIHLAAKELSFDLNIENFWERRKEFIALNPAGNVPVIFDNQNENLVIGSSVIISLNAVELIYQPFWASAPLDE
jgi:glutathione S-transferase